MIIKLDESQLWLITALAFILFGKEQHAGFATICLIASIAIGIGNRYFKSRKE